MKVIQHITEESGEGLEALLGQNVVILCAIFIYAGELVGVNGTCIKLKNASIVYETGPWNSAAWKDAQRLPSEYHYIQTAMIESFGAAI